MNRYFAATATVLTILATSCGTGPAVGEAATEKIEAGEAMPVEGEGYQGMAVYDEGVQDMLGENGEPFMPSKADVQSFEDKLTIEGMLEIDPKEEATDWWRLYAGSSFDGERQLYVAGDCRGQPQEIQVVSDGGHCHWDAQYDLTNDEMTFSFNGVA